MYRNEIDSLKTEDERADKLTELNVREQIFNLAKTAIIQKAWKEDNRPHLHGWVYGLNNGIIKPICDMEPGADLDPLYEYDNL